MVQPFEHCANSSPARHNGGDKIVTNDFQRANQCLDDENIYLTLETDGVATSFRNNKIQ